MANRSRGRYNGAPKDALDIIADLEKRIRALENAPQLKYSSVQGTNGITFIVDPDTGNVTINGNFTAVDPDGREVFISANDGQARIQFVSPNSTQNTAAIFLEDNTDVGDVGSLLSIQNSTPDTLQTSMQPAAISLNYNSVLDANFLILTTGYNVATGPEGPTALFQLASQDGASELLTRDANGNQGQFSFDTKLSFNSQLKAPQATPTVTGSKASNAALASLCTALANYGLIINSTT